MHGALQAVSRTVRVVQVLNPLYGMNIIYWQARLPGAHQHVMLVPGIGLECAVHAAGVIGGRFIFKAAAIADTHPFVFVATTEPFNTIKMSFLIRIDSKKDTNDNILCAVCDKGVTWYKISLFELDKVTEIFKKVQPDYFLHMAWKMESGLKLDSEENEKWAKAV